MTVLLSACGDQGPVESGANDNGEPDDNHAPTIHSVTASPDELDSGDTSQLTCNASDQDGDQLSYDWSCTHGHFNTDGVASVLWYSPEDLWQDINAKVEVNVTDGTVTVDQDVWIHVNTKISRVAPASDTHVDESRPDANSHDSSGDDFQEIVLCVGKVYPDKQNRVYVRFDLSSIGLNSSDVERAIVGFGSCDGGGYQPGYMASELHKVTSPWYETMVTWNTQPSWDSSVEAYAWIPLEQEEPWFEIDITDLVRWWLAHPGDNYGLMLKPEDSASHIRCFCSKEYNINAAPHLTIWRY